MNRVASKGGALRGHSPCTREGRRPDRPTAVVSGQRMGDFSVMEVRTGHGLVEIRGIREFTPVFGYTHPILFVDLRGDVGYTGGILILAFDAR